MVEEGVNCDGEPIKKLIPTKKRRVRSNYSYTRSESAERDECGDLRQAREIEHHYEEREHTTPDAGQADVG